MEKTGKTEKRGMAVQMVDAIVKDGHAPKSPEEKERLEEQKKRLSGRALEYLMFMDEDEDIR